MRKQAGQSLIELMVSIVIITTALAGIVAIFPFIIQRNMRIQLQTQAINMAQNEIERLKSLSYFDRELEALGGAQGVSSTKTINNFLIRISVKYIDPKTGKVPQNYPTELSQDTGLKELDVSVKRKDNIGAQTNLVTFISRTKSGKG